ncbi:MAG: isochorismatase family protein [Cyclobacteriaceae bacterium]
MDKKKALLIIDMQEGSFTEATPRYDTDGVVDRINTLADQCRKIGNLVIFILHDGSKWGEFIPQTKEWQPLNGLKIDPTDLFVGKTANDAFHQSQLHEILDINDISELIITGCATDFCVESTIQSAITRNFDITVVKDAHTTADREGLLAKQVIDHYNWVWQNMIPTQGTVKVLAQNEIQIANNITVN